MKKLDKLKLAESGKLMNEDEMKHIFGGYEGSRNDGGVVSCTVSVSCGGGGSVSCSSSTGDCKSIWENNIRVAVECEGQRYDCRS